MKNIKPFQFYSSLLFMLATMLLVACGDVKEKATAAVDSATEAIGEAASTAKDAVKDATNAVTEDQEIHILKRSENFIDFAHFGHYDFEHYDLTKDENSSEGDTKVKTQVYSKEGGIAIEFVDKDMGKKGYSHTYIIRDNEGKEMKKRVFSFVTEPDLKVVEKIYDLEANHLWSREKKMTVHFEEMDEKPEIMLLEPFTHSDI